jgi:cytochrome P450
MLAWVMATYTSASTLQTASLMDTIGFLLGVVAPTVAKGVIIRRPAMVTLAERLDLDRRAVERMQRLRQTYGPGPVMLRLPYLRRAVILSPEHVHRVLDNSPEPFSPASDEKRAALSHFEPKVALISEGVERERRREVNDLVLESASPVHHMASRFLPVVEQEAARILDEAHRSGDELTWPTFFDGWFRVVRRVVFGDGARDDRELTALVERLRSRANWAFAPKNHTLRARFFERLNGHLARAEPGSLAHVMARIPKAPGSAPDHQVPQWLFAFDPAGMTTFRALALLAAHPFHAATAREEFSGRTGVAREKLPFLRSCILESLRLWPTTPLVLRQSLRETTWETGVMPADTGVIIFAPFFHRDDERLPYAHRFVPEIWDGDRPVDGWPHIPFSSGPVVCPGRQLVLLLTSNMLGLLLDQRNIRLQPPSRLQEGQPLPGTLSNYTLRFSLQD